MSTYTETTLQTVRYPQNLNSETISVTLFRVICSHSRVLSPKGLNNNKKENAKTPTPTGLNTKTQMSTYTQIIYQIVFGTRNREKTLDPKNREELFKYINGLLKNKNCHCYQIGGVSDHIHIVTRIHPSVALANIIKDIKLSTTELIKTQKLFPNFRGWQEGYGAFTYSLKEKDRLVEYVKNQEAHHHKTTFMEEYRMFLEEHGVDFDEKYL